MSLGHGASVVRDGLVLHLDAANPKSYPGSGTTWSDLTSSSNNASLIGGASFSELNNGGIIFDGADDYSRPNSPHSYLQSSTLSATLKFSSYSNNNKIVLFGYRHNAGYSYPTIGTIFAVGNKFAASVITYTQVYRIVTLPSNFVVGQIYNVVLTKDVVGGNLVLYLNGGESTASQTFDADAYAQWTSAGSYIGADILDIGLSSNTTASQGWTNYFNGVMYDLKLYNRVLSPEEIKQNFEAMRGRYGI